MNNSDADSEFFNMSAEEMHQKRREESVRAIEEAAEIATIEITRIFMQSMLEEQERTSTNEEQMDFGCPLISQSQVSHQFNANDDIQINNSSVLEESDDEIICLDPPLLIPEILNPPLPVPSNSSTVYSASSQMPVQSASVNIQSAANPTVQQPAFKLDQDHLSTQQLPTDTTQMRNSNTIRFPWKNWKVQKMLENYIQFTKQHNDSCEARKVLKQKLVEIAGMPEGYKIAGKPGIGGQLKKTRERLKQRQQEQTQRQRIELEPQPKNPNQIQLPMEVEEQSYSSSSNRIGLNWQPQIPLETQFSMQAPCSSSNIRNDWNLLTSFSNAEPAPLGSGAAQDEQMFDLPGEQVNPNGQEVDVEQRAIIMSTQEVFAHLDDIAQMVDDSDDGEEEEEEENGAPSPSQPTEGTSQEAEEMHPNEEARINSMAAACFSLIPQTVERRVENVGQENTPEAVVEEIQFNREPLNDDVGPSERRFVKVRREEKPCGVEELNPGALNLLKTETDGAKNNEIATVEPRSEIDDEAAHQSDEEQSDAEMDAAVEKEKEEAPLERPPPFLKIPSSSRVVVKLPKLSRQAITQDWIEMVTGNCATSLDMDKNILAAQKKRPKLVKTPKATVTSSSGTKSASIPLPVGPSRSRRNPIDLLQTSSSLLAAVSPKLANELQLAGPKCIVCNMEFGRTHYPMHMLREHDIFVGESKQTIELLDHLSETELRKICWRCELCGNRDFMSAEKWVQHQTEHHTSTKGKKKKYTLKEWLAQKNSRSS